MSTDLERRVADAVASTPVYDVHTHLVPAQFGGLCLWGIDELVTYHYLVAETIRVTREQPEAFYSKPKKDQADVVWRTLFVENSPVSEAAIGIVTVLSELGLDPAAKTLADARAHFGRLTVEEQIDTVVNKANVSVVTMTNDPFDPRDAGVFDRGEAIDARFRAVLRIDSILNRLPEHFRRLERDGYDVAADAHGSGADELRRFLDDWIQKMNPVYLAASLPPDLGHPEQSTRSRVLTKAVLPVCRAHGLPFAMMIGVRKRVNPALGDAGDSVGPFDMSVLERICGDYPDVRFLVTVLARENQHALCVAARKFSNLTPFGCWWFVNNPSISREITRERLEMLGTSFIPQHSDARVLEQLVYKWKRSRSLVSDCLAESYADLERSGRAVTNEEIRRDVHRMFQDLPREVLGGPA